MSKKDFILAEIYRQNKHWKNSEAFFGELDGVKHHRNLLEELVQYLKKREVISVIGLRRTGKTVLLKQMMQRLVPEVGVQNIFFLTLDEDLLGGRVGLADYINNFLDISSGHRARKYIFIDEIQYARKWQHIIKRYYDTEPNIKFIISGSSALFIKKQATESLAGRIFEFELPVLSFEEYLRLRDVDQKILNSYQKNAIGDVGEIDERGAWELYNKYGAKLQKHFYDYLFYGQFPRLVNEKNIEERKKYLIEGIYNKTIEYDIPKLFKIEKIAELKFLFQVLINNLGSLVVVENLAREVGLNKETVNKYLQYFENSFLIHFLYNYSKSFRKSRRTLKKVYLASTNFYAAFRELDLLQNDSAIVGFLVENYFYNVLRKKYQNIAFYRVRQDEFDFIAAKNIFDQNQFYFEVKHVNNIRESDLKYINRFATGSRYFLISKNDLEFSDKRIIAPVWMIK